MLKKVKIFELLFLQFKYPFGGEHGSREEEWQREKGS